MKAFRAEPSSARGGKIVERYVDRAFFGSPRLEILNSYGKGNLAAEVFSEFPMQRFPGDERPPVMNETSIDADWESFIHCGRKSGIFIPPYLGYASFASKDMGSFG